MIHLVAGWLGLYLILIQNQCHWKSGQVLLHSFKQAKQFIRIVWPDHASWVRYRGAGSCLVFYCTNYTFCYKFATLYEFVRNCKILVRLGWPPLNNTLNSLRRFLLPDTYQRALSLFKNHSIVFKYIVNMLILFHYVFVNEYVVVL